MSNRVVLSCFADEIAPGFREQCLVVAALGLQCLSLRSGDVLGTGESKNVLKWTPEEVQKAKRLLREHGLTVAELGSPIGKVLLRKQDGTANRFVPWEQYLAEEVQRALDLAQEFGARRLRGFSFYPPTDEPPENHVAQAADQLSAIVEMCAARGLVLGIEVETNLVGRNGALCVALQKAVNHPNLRTVFDPGNLTTQNMPAAEVLENFRQVLPYLGWFHVKDYRIDPALVWKGNVDENRLRNFVPCDQGDSGFLVLLSELKKHLPVLGDALQQLGIDDGILLTLEPHLKGGGQFGGFSGADGMGVAMRALLATLNAVSIFGIIDYKLRGFQDMERKA